MSFAAAQARANASIFRLLATDEAELDYLPVKGKFDRAWAEALPGITTTQPRFGLRSEDAQNATLASTLVVGGETFQVRSVEPDGTGWTVLTLEATR